MAERYAKSKSEAIDQALRMFVRGPRKPYKEPSTLTTRTSYHVSVNPDLLNAAQQLAGSKADAIDRALRMFVSHHRKATNGQSVDNSMVSQDKTMVNPANISGQRMEEVSGQSPVDQEKLTKFQRERNKKLEDYDRSIKVLFANVEQLKKDVAEIPKIFDAVERITPGLTKKIKAYESEDILRDMTIDDTHKGLENVERTVQTMLSQRNQDLDNSITLNSLKNRIDGMGSQIKIALGDVAILKRKEEKRERAEKEAEKERAERAESWINRR